MSYKDGFPLKGWTRIHPSDGLLYEENKEIDSAREHLFLTLGLKGGDWDSGESSLDKNYGSTVS